MTTPTMDRRQYWLEGTSTIPFITRRKILRTVLLAGGAIVLLALVTVMHNPWLAIVALGCIAAAFLVWVRRDADGARWVLSPINQVRRALARQGRWDEFDPEVEAKPFWLRNQRILGVSGSADGTELALLDEATHLVAVLEVEGGGSGIQPVSSHVRRERAFQDILRTSARLRSGIIASQIDFITRSVPAMDEDFTFGEPAPWVTQAIATSTQQLADEGKEVAQQIRSWVAIRMPVDRLEERVQLRGAKLSEEALCEAAFDSVAQITRLMVDHGIRVYRGLSPRRLAAVIRGFLLPNRSVDDTDGIREFWDAWPAFTPTPNGAALGVFEGDATEASWHHITGSIPRRGWPASPVQGRWLAPLVLNSNLSHRVVITSAELIPPGEATALARDQLTTASSLRIRERRQGKVSMGDRDQAESSAHVVGEDLTVRSAAGLRVVTRFMVSSPTLRGLDRAREEVETLASTQMGITELWWDDYRATLGVLASLPLGRMIPRDH